MPIRHDGQITSILRNRVKPSNEKYSALPNMQISLLVHPARATKGTFRDRHGTWCGLRWTLRRQADLCPPDENAAAYGEVVWFWRRDPGVYPACLCGLGNGDNKGRSPGRARRKPSNHCAGKAGVTGCTCSDYRSCPACPSDTGLRVRLAPGFPCALFPRGTTKLHNPGEIEPRERGHVSTAERVKALSPSPGSHPLTTRCLRP